MNLTIIGSGYVGLVSGTCFAEMGNQVTCVDIDKKKINNLNNGIVPIYEPGLESLVLKNLRTKNLFFTTNLEEALINSEIVFIAVGTPMGSDGSADLQYVLSVARSIGQKMQKRLIIVDKSTVPVGTADLVNQTIQNELDSRKIDLKFDVVSNPEFLKEGAAVNDFLKPDRVIIGSNSDYAIKKMKRLYYPFCMSRDRLIIMDIRSAEMTKYAANTMLATKISFINEISSICEIVGADVNQVRVGIGSDERIGYSFIYPGVGYGGSCFPKDVRALINMANDNGFDAKLIKAVEEVNDSQKYVIVSKIINRFGENLEGHSFGIWGLSFKPGTDDMREAPSINVINELVKRGAKIKAYDPKSTGEAKNHYLKGVQNVTYSNSKYDALKDASAMILLTEWKEFRSPDFNLIKNKLKQPIIFDGRNQYNVFNIEEIGFEYYQIGKKR